MNSEQLRQRTKQFALAIIKLIRSMPPSMESQVMGKQLLRSGTSVAANYRAAGRARSLAEFVSKLSIVVEETDETLLWLELINDSNLLSEAELEALLKEARELLYIFSASRKTARENNRTPKPPNH